MSAWSDRQPAADQSAQPFLPLALHEHVELILGSAAVRAFAEARAVQMLKHGHTPAQDLDRGIDFLVREARERLTCYLDYAGFGRMTPAPERHDQLLRYLDKAGGLLIAARDRHLATIDDLAAHELARGPNAL